MDRVAAWSRAKEGTLARASPYKEPTGLVFCNAVGRGLDYRKVGADSRATVKRAGITAPGRLLLHALRRGYASLLIANGLNVVFVSRQLGHASSNVALDIYATCSNAPTTLKPPKQPWKPATRR